MKSSNFVKVLSVFSFMINVNFVVARPNEQIGPQAPVQNSERPATVSSSSSPSMNNSANNSQKSNSSTATLSKVIGVANMGLGAVKMKEFAASCAGFGATCQYGLLFQGVLHFANGRNVI